MLHCWKKKKFVPKRERETELSNFWICIASKKTEHEHESNYKRKVANVILLLWSPTILVINRDKIVNSLSTSDFRSACQVRPCRHSLSLLEFTQTPLKRKTNYKWTSCF